MGCVEKAAVRGTRSGVSNDVVQPWREEEAGVVVARCDAGGNLDGKRNCLFIFHGGWHVMPRAQGCVFCPSPQGEPTHDSLPVTVGGRRAKPTSHVYGFIACGVLPCTGEFGTKVRCTVVSVVPHRGIVHRSTFLASRSSSPRRSSLSARRVCMCPDVCDRGNLVHGCLLVKEEKGPVGLWKVR